MKEKLQRVSPESAGISSKRTQQLLKDLCSIGNELHGFMLAVDGKVICNSFAKPYGPSIPHSCHSLGKSYTATAIGLAVTQGYLTVEDKLVDIFKDEIAAMGIELQPGMEKVRVRDLLSMSSGTDGMPAFDDNWFENFLAAKIIHEPGTSFLYNTTGASMLGAIAEKVTGQNMVAYLQKNLFDKIGIEPAEIIWQSFASGITAEPGLCATTEANLRLGMFYANMGKHNGEQIISEDWMKAATSQQIENGKVHGADNGSAGYGWQLWLNTTPGMYRFDGGQGQLAIVWPNKKVVAAIHQSGRDPEGCNQCILLVQRFMEEIADAPLPEAPAAFEALRAAEDRFIPCPAPSALPKEAERFYGNYLMTEGKFMPFIQVAPVDNDFWYMFQDRSVQENAVCLEIRPAEEGLMLRMNNKQTFICGMKGEWVLQDVENVLPGLTKVACAAEYKDNGDLHIILKWLNGWSVSDIILSTTHRPGDLVLVNTKDMLHEYAAPMVQNCKARKIKL